MKARMFLIAVLGLVAGACADRATGPQGPGPPQQISIAGVKVTLEANLTRDFMPITPPDGRPLLATLGVRGVNGAPLPSGLVMTSAAITFGGETWQSTPEIIPISDPTLLLGQSRDGPKWGPGVTADVVVTLELGGRQVQLGAPQQPIKRTD